MISGRGILWAYLCENKSVGLHRDVYWGLSLSELHGKEVEAGELEAINCEWLTFPVRRLVQLTEISLDDCLHPNLVECSIYLNSEHHLVRLESLSFKGITSDAELTVHAALSPNSGADAPLPFKGVVRFEGLIVVPQSLEPSPKTLEEAARLAARYVDLDTLKPPVWDRFRYLFKPLPFLI